MTVHGDAGVVLPGDGRVFWTGRTEAQVKIEAAEDRSFVVFEASPPPGVPGPPQHVHRDYDEAWHILDGQVEFDLGTDTYLCPTGSLVFAPRELRTVSATADRQPPECWSRPRRQSWRWSRIWGA